MTVEMLADRFGSEVAHLVESVTETDKELTWEERKQEALKHIAGFSNESVLVKSADVISNTSELLDDYAKEGEGIWVRFNAPKEKLLENAQNVIAALLLRWPENPLAADLKAMRDGLQRMGGVK